MPVVLQAAVTVLAFFLVLTALAVWRETRMARIRLDEATTKLNYELTMAQHELNKQQVELQLRQAGFPTGGVRLALEDAQKLLQCSHGIIGDVVEDRLRHAIEQAGGV